MGNAGRSYVVLLWQMFARALHLLLQLLLRLLLLLLLLLPLLLLLLLVLLGVEKKKSSFSYARVHEPVLTRTNRRSDYRRY